MLEAVRALAGDRRAALARDEVAREEVVEHRLDVLDLGASRATAPCQKMRPITEARCSSRFSLARQPVDARARSSPAACRGSASRDVPPSSSIRVVSSTKSGLPSVFSSSVLRSDVESSPVVEQRIQKLFALRGVERLERDRRRAHAAAAPAGPDVEQLGPREADDQQRHVLDALGEVLDQVEQRLLGPVDVLEDEHERLRVGELGRPLAGRPGDLLLAPLGLDRLEHADGEREQVGDRVVAAAGAQLRDGLLRPDRRR